MVGCVFVIKVRGSFEYLYIFMVSICFCYQDLFWVSGCYLTLISIDQGAILVGNCVFIGGQFGPLLIVVWRKWVENLGMFMRPVYAWICLICYMRLALSYIFYHVSLVVYECVPESEFYSFPSIKCTLVRGGLFCF